MDATQNQNGQEDQGVDMPDTADVPLTFFGTNTPKEGDTMTIKVVSVDQDNGMATVECESGEGYSKGGGIDGMMASADQESEQ